MTDHHLTRRTWLLATAAAALLAPAGSVALAQEDTEPRSERAKGAPGYFCKQQGAQPGTAGWERCVTLAARARSQARQDESDDDGASRSRSATGRFCQDNGAVPGSEAFRRCAATARTAARAATRSTAGTSARRAAATADEELVTVNGVLASAGRGFTVDGTELGFGPPWHVDRATAPGDLDGDGTTERLRDELEGLAGRRVTVTGEREASGELSVRTLDGTVVRAPGRPPWAGPPPHA
jgi:hypothetical protein